MTFAAHYIIVGGGSAGAVLATRLSESGRRGVLLLEAGGEADGWLVQIPAGMAKLVGNPAYDWLYPQDPDPTINGRSFNWSAGKLLGGGSSINGQVFIRGTRRDFDQWEELGATGWNYDNCLPYFVKMERCPSLPGPHHGSSGALGVEPMLQPHPLTRVFLASCAQHGLATLDDYGDGKMAGAYLTMGSQHNARRASTERAYLRPARRRRNLRVVTTAKV